MPPRHLRLIGALCGALCTASSLTACSESGPGEMESGRAPAIVAPSIPAAPAPDTLEARNASHAAPPPPGELQVFFGDLHVHSSWSFDAYGAGVTARPIHAYQYARGQAIPHLSGNDIQLAGPALDFVALTDHAEYLGLTAAASKPDHSIHRQPLIQSWVGSDPELSDLAWRKILASFQSREEFPALSLDSVVVPAWTALVRLANEQYEPGRFTTFIGFEYTADPDAQNLHRNLLFRGAEAPHRPFSSMDSGNPEDLWDWMDETRASGIDLLAIPHNSNGSNGRMFAPTRFDGSPLDAAWAAQRARNEPVAEVFQIKGQSETHPALSPEDEWAGFEIADWRTTAPGLPSQPSGSYVRDALQRGLVLGEALGENPYALGVLGSTDGHMSSSPFEERNYTGKIGRGDSTPEERLAYTAASSPAAEPVVSVHTKWSAAGLAGIWAPENTRAALFDAIRRRETFATSGPRIRVQFFAQWETRTIPADEAARTPDEPGSVRQAERTPMGGVLEPSPARVPDSNSPRSPLFSVTALQDPLDAPLERAQIVKGWLDGKLLRERVFDVACASGQPPDPTRRRCPDESVAPDLETCRPAPGLGASELRADWRDPAYDSRLPAFYYARIIQVPSCRWSTYDANRIERPRHPGVPATIQERAVTSPIWLPRSAN